MCKIHLMGGGGAGGAVCKRCLIEGGVCVRDISWRGAVCKRYLMEGAGGGCV